VIRIIGADVDRASPRLTVWRDTLDHAASSRQQSSPEKRTGTAPTFSASVTVSSSTVSGSHEFEYACRTSVGVRERHFLLRCEMRTARPRRVPLQPPAAPKRGLRQLNSRAITCICSVARSRCHHHSQRIALQRLAVNTSTTKYPVHRIRSRPSWPSSIIQPSSVDWSVDWQSGHKYSRWNRRPSLLPFNNMEHPYGWPWLKRRVCADDRIVEHLRPARHSALASLQQCVPSASTRSPTTTPCAPSSERPATPATAPEPGLFTSDCRALSRFGSHRTCPKARPVDLLSNSPFPVGTQLAGWARAFDPTLTMEDTIQGLPQCLDRLRLQALLG